VLYTHFFSETHFQVKIVRVIREILRYVGDATKLEKTTYILKLWTVIGKWTIQERK